MILLPSALEDLSNDAVDALPLLSVSSAIEELSNDAVDELPSLLISSAIEEFSSDSADELPLLLINSPIEEFFDVVEESSKDVVAGSPGPFSIPLHPHWENANSVKDAHPSFDTTPED